MASPLGDKIRSRRLELGMSLDQLAKATSSSKGYVWELENRDKANPSADKLIKLAAALEITPEVLLDQSPKIEHADEVVDAAFFRSYKSRDVKVKEKVRKFLEMWDDED